VAGEAQTSVVLPTAEEAETVTFEGGKPLVGEVEVRGAKNLVTKAMVAALLGDSPSIFARCSPYSRRRCGEGALGSSCRHGDRAFGWRV